MLLTKTQRTIHCFVLLQTLTSAKFPECVLRSVRTRKVVINVAVTRATSGTPPTTDVEPPVIQLHFHAFAGD